MASSVCVFKLPYPVRLHAARPAAIMADCPQLAANAHVRLARRAEVRQVLTLIQQQAEYHGLREKCVATLANLEAGLFDSVHDCSAITGREDAIAHQLPQSFLHGPAVLLLELSPSSFAPTAHLPYGADAVESEAMASSRPALYPAEKLSLDSNGHTGAAENSTTVSSKELATNLCYGNGVAHTFMLPELIKDPHALSFRSAEGRIIAGFAMIFRKYISFEAKHAMYMEDLYVREGLRGYGFGTVLLRAVARLAMELDCCAVEFRVVDWNKKALKLYESMGVKLSAEWQSCLLSGEDLETCGSSVSAIFADLGKSRKLAAAQFLQTIGAY